MICAECGVRAYKTHACHGNRSAYQRGCRCAVCSEANAIGQRRYRGPGTRTASKLESRCWCERKLVRVTAEDVRAGRTASCGRTGCEAQAVSV